MKPTASRVRTVDVDTPFAERLIGGFGYPLRGAALATCVALTLSHFAGLLPLLGGVANFAIWLATWRYAADCLMHTANGFADPPDAAIEIHSAQGWSLALIHIFAYVFCVLCAYVAPHSLWIVLPCIIFLLPAIDMSLAFDGNLAIALNPFKWGAIIGKFGAAYFIPVVINLLLTVLMVVSTGASEHLPRLLSLPISSFLGIYLTILGFHLMGVMIHQRHEHFGMVTEAHELAEQTGQDSDTRLLTHVEELEATDPEAAIRLLVERMRERHAAAPLHKAYRRLLQKQGHRDALIEHGHIWIAALLTERQPRQALGVLQDCVTIDPDFMPDEPDMVGELAENAERFSMARLALRLCKGYLARWPRDTQALSYGLLAVRLLDGPLQQPAEARVLLAKLLAQYGDHPQREAMDALSRQLQMLPSPS